MSENASLVILGDDDDHGPPPRGLVSLNEPRRPALGLPDATGLAALQAYGEVIAQSKLYKNIPNWQAAVMVLRYGVQLGIDEFTALTDIYWIEGVPTASAKLMTALIERDHGGNWLLPVESSATVCEVQFKRREWSEYQTARVTIEEYKHLRSKANWQNHPADMLWARLISRIARRFFASTIKGLYTPDEIDESRAIETTARVVEQAKPEPRATKLQTARSPVRVDQAPDAPDVPDVPDKPNAPDPGPSRPPRASPNTPEAIIATWLGNIERARTVHRLDEIAAMLVNAGLGDEESLMQALSDRSVTLHAEEAAARVRDAS